MIRIERKALEFMLGASRELYPREFAGMLRAEDEVITEVIVLPATVYGNGFALTKPHMAPIDRSLVGSVHSHPSRNRRPSSTDLVSFGKKGWVHFILSYPFGSEDDMSAYDSKGEPVDFSII